MSPSTSTKGSQLGYLILLILLALSPLHTKILGVAWLGFFLLGLMRLRQATHSVDDVDRTTRIWFFTCLISLLLAAICALVWKEEGGILNPQMRLFLAAGAALLLIRRGTISASARNWLLHGLAAAATVAFFWTANLAWKGAPVRDQLASNAIPWAVAISLITCLLAPAAFAASASTRQRLIWLGAAILGVVATLLAQTRGALLVLPWCALVVAWFWHHHKKRAVGFAPILAIAVCVLAAVLAAAWYSPKDPLRMHETVNDIQDIRATKNYNSSIGARVYLWELAEQGITQSPWIGIGSIERKYRIEHTADGQPPEELAKYATVRSVGHVHNQYLNSALDGGMIGLASLLALLVGMGMATVRLARIDPVPAWQLGGVLFMHATSGVSNVNFLHNYYVMALSLAVVVPFLYARSIVNRT